MEGAAKWFCMPFVLCFVAGWLTHEWIKGEISDDNKAALLIMLATIITIIVILCTVGIRRWKGAQLSAMEKRLMFSLCFCIQFFMFSDGLQRLETLVNNRLIYRIGSAVGAPSL
jgi:hypothetical protein